MKFLIKIVAFDLDDTIFNGTLLVEKARRSSVQMMIDYGLPVEIEYAMKLLNEIVAEFGSNSEHHLDNLIKRLRHDPKVQLDLEHNSNKYVSAGIMGYHREKVKHFKPFRDVIKTLGKLKQLNLKTAIITDGMPIKQYEKILRLKIEDKFDKILISDEVAIRKPNSYLFKLFINDMGCLPEEVLYVGDRVDRDVGPGNEAGMVTVLIHRGTKHDPYITKQKFSITPDYHINSLNELFPIIASLANASQ